MRKLIYLILSIIGLVSIYSCEKPDIFAEHHVERNEISLYMKDGEILTYNILDSQLSYNEKTNEFRVIKDDMRFFSVKVLIPIEENSQTVVNLQWNTSGKVYSKAGIACKVLKIDDEGKIWLWNKDSKIGIVIKAL